MCPRVHLRGITLLTLCLKNSKKTTQKNSEWGVHLHNTELTGVLEPEQSEEAAAVKQQLKKQLMDSVRCVIFRKSEQEQWGPPAKKMLANTSPGCNLHSLLIYPAHPKEMSKHTQKRKTKKGVWWKKKLIEVAESAQNLLNTHAGFSPSTNNLQPFQGIKPQMQPNNPSVIYWFIYLFSLKSIHIIVWKSRDDAWLAFEMKDDDDRLKKNGSWNPSVWHWAFILTVLWNV